MILKIGITGGIGSGKTLVCNVFKHLGVPVFNSDVEAKLLLINNTRIRKEIVQNFGRKIYGKDGNLQTAILSDIIFKDTHALRRLNDIVHPAVNRRFSEWQKVFMDKAYVIQEAAILFESGAYRFLDKIVTIFADEKVRMERIMQRDHFSVQKIKEIMQNQVDEKLKLDRADYIIYNNPEDCLLPQIFSLHQNFLNLK